MNNTVIIAITAIIVVVVVGMVALMLINNQSERRKRILNVVRGKAGHDNSNSKANSQDQRRADLAKKLKESGEDPKSGDKKPGLPQMIVQAGLEISVQKFWISSIVFAVIATFLVKVMGYSNFVVIMAFITSLLGIPRFVLITMAKNRQKKFLEDFADALESMVRLLKAGMPVSEAIKMVAREFTGPVGDEMTRIFDQQQIGVPLPDAVLSCTERMPIQEMKMFATAIAIQTQTGSSLSEVLQNLANVIRARFRLKRKVQALSSEAKASAGIIGALPFFVALGMYFMNRDYIEILFITSQGKFVLGGAIFWMCIGILVMRQMINFKV